MHKPNNTTARHVLVSKNKQNKNGIVLIHILLIYSVYQRLKRALKIERRTDLKIISIIPIGIVYVGEQSANTFVRSNDTNLILSKIRRKKFKGRVETRIKT